MQNMWGFFLFPPVMCEEFGLILKSNLWNGIDGISFYILSHGLLAIVNAHFIVKSLNCFDINQMYMNWQ